MLSTGEEHMDLVVAARQREYTRRLEDDVTGRINSILEPIIGSGNYKAEVSADVDFTEIEKAEEIFNPDFAGHPK